METLKKFWWVIVIVLAMCVATGIVVWNLKPTKTIVQEPSQVQPHKFDSLKYIQKTDSLSKVISDLKKENDKKEKQYSLLLRNQKQQVVAVENLSEKEVIDEFSVRTGDKASQRDDSTAIISIFSMRKAISLFVERDQCLERETTTLDQGDLTRSIITSQDSMLIAKDKRIIDLTKEFYDSQLKITGLNVAVAKYDRKIRTKNVFLGILGGIAVVGITGTIISIVK